MKIPVTDSLIAICKEIEAQKRLVSEWAAIESDDLFQSGPVSGGFDATENEFTFSYYDDANQEWWFQLSLNDTNEIVSGKLLSVDARKAEY